MKLDRFSEGPDNLRKMIKAHADISVSRIGFERDRTESPRIPEVENESPFLISQEIKIT